MILYLCVTVTDKRQATNRWLELPLVFKQDISQFCRNLQLHGRARTEGDTSDHVSWRCHIHVLHCKASQKHPAAMIKILQTYFANDMSESH